MAKQKQQRRVVKNPEPMANTVSMGRYGISLIKDITFGNFNFQKQSYLFGERNFLLATLREVNEKIDEANAYCFALQTVYYQNPNPRFHDLLKKHNQSLEAWQIVKYALESMLMNGDLSMLLFLMNRLPGMKNGITA